MKTRHRFNRISRKIHTKVALWTTFPIIVIILSGLVLQVKKEFSWIQPQTKKGSPYQLKLGPNEILVAAKKSNKASIHSWKDIDRLDIRPSKGVVKVRAKNRWEMQIDMSSGVVLQEAYRRSDLIESIHDGSFFHEYARLGVFFPVGISLLLLWCTGVVILSVTFINKRNNQKKVNLEKIL